METLLPLLDRMEELGDREAIWLDNGYRGQAWTYKILRSRIRAAAAQLATFAPQERDGDSPAHIVVWAAPSPEWVCAFWATLSCGIRVVPLDPGTAIERVERIAQDVRAALVLTDRPESASRFEARNIRCLHPADLKGDSTTPLKVQSMKPINGDAVAQILFSSGTTGDPHGVIHRHRHLVSTLRPVASEIQRYQTWMRPFQPIRILNSLPLSHVFGQLMGLFAPVLVGGSVVFTSDQHPRRLVQTIRRRRVSVLSAVPRLADTVQTELDVSLPPERDFPSGVRGVAARWWYYRDLHRRVGFKFWTVVVGGAQLPTETEQFYKKVGLAVIQGYGMTEASALITANHPLRTQSGSIGKPVPGQQVRLAEDGEILVRGESVSHETYDSTSLDGIGGRQGEKDAADWLATGDIGEMQADGSILFRGRKKDMIVGADGLNVFPSDLESILLAVNGVRDAVVVGKSSPTGDIPFAVLRLDENTEAQNVVYEANRRLEPYQRIKGHGVWPEPDFPRTTTSKVKRHLVRQWVETNQVPPATSGATSSPREVVEQFLAQRCGVEQAFENPELILDELGLGSLDRVELLASVERSLGRSLSPESFSAIESVGQLVTWIEQLSEKPAPHRTASEVGPAGLSLDSDPDPTDTHEARPDEPDRSGFADTRGYLRRAIRFSNRTPARFVRAVIRDAFTRPLVRHFLQPTIDPEPPSIEPPFILAANHASHLDTPAIVGILPTAWRFRVVPAMSPMHFAPYFLGNASRFKRFRAGLRYWAAVTIFNAYPLFASSETLEDVLLHLGVRAEHGDCPLIFPEGVRNPEGILQRLHAGVGFMATSLELPVVPIYLEGTAESLPPGRRWPKRVPLHVRWGEALYPDTSETASGFTERLTESLRKLEQSAEQTGS